GFTQLLATHKCSTKDKKEKLPSILTVSSLCVARSPHNLQLLFLTFDWIVVPNINIVLQCGSQNGQYLAILLKSWDLREERLKVLTHIDEQKRNSAK
ncbi:TPA: hypothetical protein ACGEF9_004718, partial [Yersinia enterocolitica]